MTLNLVLCCRCRGNGGVRACGALAPEALLVKPRRLPTEGSLHASGEPGRCHPYDMPPRRDTHSSVTQASHTHERQTYDPSIKPKVRPGAESLLRRERQDGYGG